MNNSILRLASIVSLVAATACGSDPMDPEVQTGLSLEGVWTVTTDAGTPFGLGGITTLEFGMASGGIADFRTAADANGIQDCAGQVYALIGQEVVALDSEFYVVEATAANRMVFTTPERTLILDRVAGTPPLDPCGVATAVEVETFDFAPGSFTNLNAVGSTLYFNLQVPGDSITTYDTQAGTLGTPRAYTQRVSDGTHRWVIGAQSDSRFYGHCGCGGSTSVDYFDLVADSSIDFVEVDTDLGVNLRVRYGYYAGANIIVGGQDRDNSLLNRLLTLEVGTLALVSQRTVLDEVLIADVALRGSDLLALVGDQIVMVGSSGRATVTYDISGIGSTPPRGMTVVNDDVYVIGQDEIGDAVLYRVTLQ